MQIMLIKPTELTTKLSLATRTHNDITFTARKSYQTNSETQ
jgi:hypothetical protein